jgi:hypothetical protein
MKKISTLVVIVLSVSVFYACKKKSNDDEPPKTPPVLVNKQDILSANLWIIQSVNANGTDIWNSPFPIVSNCYKDNHYKFRKDDKMVIFDNTNKCETTDPDSAVNNYKYFESSNQMYIDATFSAGIAIKDTTNVLELSSSTLKIDAEYSGIPAVITFIKKP